MNQPKNLCVYTSVLMISLLIVLPGCAENDSETSSDTSQEYVFGNVPTHLAEQGKSTTFKDIGPDGKEVIRTSKITQVSNSLIKGENTLVSNGVTTKSIQTTKIEIVDSKCFFTEISIEYEKKEDGLDVKLLFTPGSRCYVSVNEMPFEGSYTTDLKANNFSITTTVLESYSFIKNETIEVTAGIFNAQKISLTRENTSNTGKVEIETFIYWRTDDVGTIKTNFSDGSTSELLSFSIL